MEDTDPAVADADLEMLRRIRPDEPIAKMTATEYLATTAHAVAGSSRRTFAFGAVVGTVLRG